MPLFLYGQSALELTRHLRAVNDGSLPGVVVRPRNLSRAVNKTSQVKQLPHRAQLMLSHVTQPMHVMVAERSQHVHSKSLETHLWSGELPSGSFINLGNGIYLPTPAFLFLQLAVIRDELALTQIGLELCGHYSMWRLPGPRASVSQLDEFAEPTYFLRPALGVQQLTAFLERMVNVRGHVRACAAAKRVLDHSASPMESAVYLLLCLPRSKGGRGLPSPVLNARVNVNTSEGTVQRYPDLFWPRASGNSVDVEYQSDLGHQGEANRHRDSRRAIELEGENVSVLHLTSAQIMDSDGFNEFANSLRRMLGVRTRPLPNDWDGRYLALRERLLPEDRFWASR